MCMAQYADRLPIGLEKVIREAPADVVKAFYERWYRPQNMAGELLCLSTEFSFLQAKLPILLPFLVWSGPRKRPGLSDFSA